MVSVSRIYDYYKQYGYNTIVMGASFRSVGEVLELAGCDRLTIGPNLLAELADSAAEVQRKLNPVSATATPSGKMSEAEFRWQLNQDAMATEKLAEGIRNFAVDQAKLEDMVRSRF